MDLGIMVEGFVEVDPMDGRILLRIPQEDGGSRFLDVQGELAAQNGREVRLIVTPLESIAELAKIVECGGIDV
jgi:hypothetical protein